MEIVGLKIEKYIDKKISGHNCSFNYYDAEFERHILMGILSDGRKIHIKLYETVGECGSGWTTASWGHIEINEVANFGGYTYKAKEKIVIDDLPINFDISSRFSSDIYNKVFNVSYDGDDSYYPSGFYNVNMDLFIETNRSKKKRPVWIFVSGGKSNVGKSFLASKLEGLNIYETDSSPKLPESLIADVIVLGNKYNFSLDDIKKRVFGDSEICIVEFKRDSE